MITIEPPEEGWHPGNVYKLLVLMQMAGNLYSVKLSPDRTRLTFTHYSGEFVFRTVGGCCSKSWVEHLEMPRKLEYPIMAINYKRDFQEAEIVKNYGDGDDEYSHRTIRFYAIDFVLSSGTISVEFRNDSNGYYSGTLELESASIDWKQMTEDELTDWFDEVNQ